MKTASLRQIHAGTHNQKGDHVLPNAKITVSPNGDSRIEANDDRRKGNALVDFYATDSISAERMRPILNALKGQMGPRLRIGPIEGEVTQSPPARGIRALCGHRYRVQVPWQRYMEVLTAQMAAPEASSSPQDRPPCSVPTQ